MQNELGVMEDYLSQLQQIREQIQQLQQQHKELIIQRNFLKQKTKELSVKSARGYSTQRIERDHQLTDFVTNLLNKHKRPLNINEICRAMQDANVDFIPLQIISLKTYVTRRLKSACDEGIFQQLLSEDQLVKLYALPSWEA